MPVVNPLARELVFKIVYYGPGLGGKTTSLQHVHSNTKPEYRGKMVSLATPVDRTLYFDFLPLRVPNVGGMNVRLQLFTVPGQVYYNATRKLVLTGADGVVLVYDSQRARSDANRESLENLRENLAEHGRTLEELPHVVQLNKRDLSDISDVEEMNAGLNPHGVPCFETVATSGTGLYEALDAITRAVIEDLSTRSPDSRSLDGEWLELPEDGLAEALRGEAESQPSPGMGPEPDDEVEDLRLTGAPPASQGELAARAVSGAALRRASDRAPETHRSDVPGPRRSEAARSAPPSERARRPSVPPLDSQRFDVDETPDERTWGFASLWPRAERDTVLKVEAALADGRWEEAVRLSDQLVARAFAGTASLLGGSSAPREPAVVALLLGVDGRRYLAFRSLVREVRAGRKVEQREALGAYVFALEVRDRASQ